MNFKDIFSTLELATKVATYLGLIESLDIKVDRLMQSKLNAGVAALQQAATSYREKEHLLREARMQFNQAVSLEDGERLLAAYIGLGLCHHQLGDKDNCRAALYKATNVELPQITLESAAVDLLYLTNALGVAASLHRLWEGKDPRIGQRMLNSKNEKCRKLMKSISDFLENY